MRQLERIEENYMRQLLKTKKSCPIVQLYLELGQVPVRFDIIKLRLYFLKFILHQNPENNVLKMYHLQLENPKRGDWASSVRKNLEELNINLSNEEIKTMSKYKYKSLVKKKCKEKALEYLISKRGKKGRDIKYKSLKMAEYLLPNEQLSVEEKRNIFEIRNRMTNIPSNFTTGKNMNMIYCICGEKENMTHIYYCQKLNSKEPETNFEKIYGENLKEIENIEKRFRKNMKQRETFQEILDCDPPLSYILDDGNG